MMSRKFLLFSLVISSLSGFAAEFINPTISPALFRPSDPITITYDVTGTSLQSLTSAYLWIWIPGKDVSVKYNINPASSDPAKTDEVKFTKSVVNGRTLFTIAIVPANLFVTNISAETQVGVLLKGNDWSNGQTTDFISTFWDGNFQVKLTNPLDNPHFVSSGEDISIEAETPVLADYSLSINGVEVDTQSGILNYIYNHTATETSGAVTVLLTATAGTSSAETSFQYFISSPSEIAVRPLGIIPGINYENNDATRVTLCLWAPDKTSVYAIGDFSDWSILSSTKMKRDGEYFWITLDDLTPGEEYGYQYLVEEEVYVADPYADKILDPDDQYIPVTSYPALKPYPQASLKNEWYFNRVSVFQTGQAPFQWEITNFQKPPKEELIVYELLIRDFFSENERTYQNLIDTIPYFKRLGINAVELMPIMEFNGNESWGYNPTFMFAPDKYYGTKNKLKEFIDRCHEEGIAVILDIAMNHQDIPNTYAMIDFDFENGRPSATNKWFNTEARHPFNVFNDMNHESSYTKTYLDTVNYYWLNEYKVDGFRFDLSKGFTQTNNPNNVGAWGAYDASRITLLKRMADKIWASNPDAYIILEHFADNPEEKELAEYRKDEGKGMLLWGNLNHSYNQNTMGFADDSDFSWISSSKRTWEVQHVVGYMESHDEERLVYKNLSFGNSMGGYSVKTKHNAIARQKAANVLFLTLPGPKMIWQFGEYGYDKSINTCEDGSINGDCRISPKPVLWEYQNDPDRNSLFIQTADLLRLRKAYSVFSSGTVTFSGMTSLQKQVTIKNVPYTETPTSASQMNVHIVSNFGVEVKSITVTFPHIGNWYDYYDYGTPLAVTANPTIVLAPGEFKLFTDFPIDNLITTVEDELNGQIVIYPNPTTRFFKIDLPSQRIDRISIKNLNGKIVLEPVQVENDSWDVSTLDSGVYIVEMIIRERVYHRKLIKP